MRTALFAALVAATTMVGTTTQASAGGWQGGDHSIFREHFEMGFTLARLWRHLDNR